MNDDVPPLPPLLPLTPQYPLHLTATNQAVLPQPTLHRPEWSGIPLFVLFALALPVLYFFLKAWSRPPSPEVVFAHQLEEFLSLNPSIPHYLRGVELLRKRMGIQNRTTDEIEPGELRTLLALADQLKFEDFTPPLTSLQPYYDGLICHLKPPNTLFKS